MSLHQPGPAMISVTQPRRPADDFLASLQSNLQGNARTRRKRGVSDAVQKSKVAPKEQIRAKPPPQQKTKQNRVKSEPVVRDRNSVPKKSAKLPKAAKSNSPELKPSHNGPNSRNPIPSSKNDVQVEVLSSQPPQPTAPTSVQHPALPVEVVQNLPVPNYQYPVTLPAEDPVQQQQNIRASQNNFYMKNQSNIFNTGFSHYQAQSTTHQAMRSSVADKVVVENALRIASQQPLPAPPSFSIPRSYVRPEESINQHSLMPNNNGMVMQQTSLVTTQPENVMTVQPHIVIAAQDQSNLIHKVVGPQHRSEQTPTINEGKPMNSHYTQSFSITGGVQHDNRTAQELERRKWIQELEAQVREKKERDQQEKMRQKSPYPAPLPSGLHSAVPNYQPTPAYNIPVSSTLQQVNYPPHIAQQPTTLQQVNYPPHIAQQPTTLHTYTAQQSTALPAHTSQQPTTIPSNSLLQTNTRQMPNINIQSPHLAPKSPAQQPAESPTQGRMLGQGAWVDPVEMERRQEARKRALENQEMIRKQVEERERLKKEEREKIKREEELEMKRIEEEKRRMAEEARLELEKRRKKEEAQLQQIVEMRRKIEEANKSAQEEKRSKRNRSAIGNDQNENVNMRTTVLEEKSLVPIEEIRTKNQRSSSVATNVKPGKEQQNAQTLADIAPVQETVQQAAPVQLSVPVQLPVRYVSNASTQTVHEVSCQTMSRENSFLPADSKLIQLQERELSVVQRKQSINNNIANSNSNKRTHNKPKPGSKLPVKKQQTKKVPEIPKVQYDRNGRRIRPKAAEPPPQEETPPPSNIIAEESEAITDYKTIADIFDDPESPVMEVESVGPSPFTVSDQQVQMRYTSPKNEKRSIPSAISVRQNDILSQLEKLRMGLRDRRRHMSSAEIIQ